MMNTVSLKVGHMIRARSTLKTKVFEAKKKFSSINGKIIYCLTWEPIR